MICMISTYFTCAYPAFLRSCTEIIALPLFNGLDISDKNHCVIYIYIYHKDMYIHTHDFISGILVSFHLPLSVFGNKHTVSIIVL